MNLENPFKAALAAGQLQIGLWAALANPYTTEICAGAGFDWLLLDSEHAPNDLRSLLAELQAMAPYATAPVVRPRTGDVHLVKQILDIGAQNLLVPMIETAAEAALMVQAVRYPPHGVRGVGSALARASRWNRVPRYLDRADAEMCLLVQVETRKGLDNIEAIAVTPGVDGVFIGPSDLAASLGHLGDPANPEVQRAIAQAVPRILAAGKAPGILATTDAAARAYLDLGCRFVAVGTDVGLLARNAEALAARYGANKQTC
jgi:4-hydroxy-2-oxoheptanedioate aldolase